MSTFCSSLRCAVSTHCADLDAPKTEMIAAAGDFALAARADHVASAVLLGAKERATSMHAFGLARLGGVEAARGPLRVASHPARGLVGIGIRAIPIRAPFPDIAGHVVEAVAIGRELGRRERCRQNRRRQYRLRETVPARCWPSTCRRAEFFAPRVWLARHAAAGRAIPTRPRSAAVCRPSGRKPRHRHRPHAPRDIRRGRQ